MLMLTVSNGPGIHGREGMLVGQGVSHSPLYPICPPPFVFTGGVLSHSLLEVQGKGPRRELFCRLLSALFVPICMYCRWSYLAL